MPRTCWFCNRCNCRTTAVSPFGRIHFLDCAQTTTTTIIIQGNCISAVCFTACCISRCRCTTRSCKAHCCVSATTLTVTTVTRHTILTLIRCVRTTDCATLYPCTRRARTCTILSINRRCRSVFSVRCIYLTTSIYYLIPTASFPCIEPAKYVFVIFWQCAQVRYRGASTTIAIPTSRILFIYWTW